VPSTTDSRTAKKVVETLVSRDAKVVAPGFPRRFWLKPSTNVWLRNVCADRLAHNATFRHTAGLAVDNGASNWGYNNRGYNDRGHDNRTSNWSNDAAPRHTDGLAIDNGMGWPTTHGNSGERYQRGHR